MEIVTEIEILRVPRGRHENERGRKLEQEGRRTSGRGENTQTRHLVDKRRNQRAPRERNLAFLRDRRGDFSRSKRAPVIPRATLSRFSSSRPKSQAGTALDAVIS